MALVTKRYIWSMGEFSFYYDDDYSHRQHLRAVGVSENSRGGGEGNSNSRLFIGLKRTASKVAHNWPLNSFFHVAAGSPNQPRIDFSC